jgi:hypothetical protein
MIDLIPYFAGIITLMFMVGFYLAIRNANRAEK